MTVLLAAPTAVPDQPGAVSFGGLRVTWEGWDGTAFELSSRSSGVYLRPGVRGWSMPEWQPFRSQSAVAPGFRHRGARAQGRSVFWNVGVYHGDGGQAWLDYDRAFWRTMHPDREGTWRVQLPGALGSRSLRLRFAGDDALLEVDPTRVGWQAYGVDLVADQPFCEGEPITAEFSEASELDFFGADSGQTGAPPFYISSSSSFATATMSNPGDEPGYPVWVAEGPFTSVTVGVGGRLITAPISIAEGQSLTIDPRPGPRGKSAYDSTGARRTSELTARDFAPIPPGQEVPLSLAMTGTGSVRATLVPLYHRMW